MQADSLCQSRPAKAGPLPDQRLVDGIAPAKALADVDFVVPEHHAVAAVGLMAPDIAVAVLGPVLLRRRLFQGLPPAGVKDLVQVGADIEVAVLRRQLQREIAGVVKAPGLNLPADHMGAQRLQPLRRTVGRAGVQDVNPVCLGHGSHPPGGEFRLVPADGVDIELHPSRRTTARERS